VTDALPDRTLRIDVSAERSVGVLRLVAAAIVLAGVVAIVATRPAPLGYLVVALCLLVAALFARAFVLSVRRTKNAGGYFLRLTEKSLELSEDTRQIAVDWEQIRSVNVNQDRLVVELARHSGQPIQIEPRYPNLGIDELASMIEAYRIRAEARATEPRPANQG
jgi:hypothetical protein